VALLATNRYIRSMKMPTPYLPTAASRRSVQWSEKTTVGLARIFICQHPTIVHQQRTFIRNGSTKVGKQKPFILRQKTNVGRQATIVAGGPTTIGRPSAFVGHQKIFIGFRPTIVPLARNIGPEHLNVSN